MNPDPLRPPETDEEPWAADVTHEITVDDDSRGLWLGCILLMAVLAVGFAVGAVLATVGKP